jgi:hypothetical protein
VFQRFFVRICSLPIALLLSFIPCALKAETIESLKAGVVKITAEVGGTHRVGTGFIVRLEKRTAYILTASHVVEGDPHAQITFFTMPHNSFPARTLGLEGGDPNGLAVLLVEGELPDGLRTLTLDPSDQIHDGEAVKLIGFPRIAGTTWMVTEGTMGGQFGGDLIFSGVLDEGNSGGPLLLKDKVVGIITQMNVTFGYATPILTAQFALKGWGIQVAKSKDEGDRLDTQEQTLEIIANFADRFCMIVPHKGPKESVGLSEQGKTEIEELLMKVVELGNDGAVKYNKTEHQRVLQKDLNGLAALLNDHNNCRLEVWRGLKAKLLNTTTPEEPVSIVNIKMDEKESEWFRIPFKNYMQKRIRPYFFDFSLGNHLVKPYKKLRPELQEMFEDTYYFLKERIASGHFKVRREQHLKNFSQIDPVTFYKSVILFQMLEFPMSSKSLDELGDFYDLSEEFKQFKEMPNLEIDDKGNFIEVPNYEYKEYKSEFYVYDVSAIRAVKSVLTLGWPDSKLYARLVKNGEIPESIKLFKFLFMRTKDPIFDITLLNNSSATQILHRMDIVVERVWSVPKGIPFASIIEPLITYRVPVDCSKKINAFDLNSPLAFGEDSPARFKVQFLNFSENCKGNMAEIKFRFVLNEKVVESQKFVLDF